MIVEGIKFTPVGEMPESVRGTAVTLYSKEWPYLGMVNGVYSKPGCWWTDSQRDTPPEGYREIACGKVNGPLKRYIARRYKRAMNEVTR